MVHKEFLVCYKVFLMRIYLIKDIFLILFMLSPRNIVYLISVVVTSLLGTAVFLKKPKGKINRTFFGFVLAMIGWLVSLFLFYWINFPTWVLWIGRFNFAIVLIMLFYLLRFVEVFPRKTISIPKLIWIILSVWFFLFAAITFLTPLVGQDEIITGPAQRETVYGPLYYLYIFHYLFISVFSIIVIFLKLKRSGDKAEKYQLMYLVSGLVVGLGWGFCTNILFPVLKLFEMPQNYGPLAPILLVGFIARGIFKHGLFDIKIIATEIFSILYPFY